MQGIILALLMRSRVLFAFLVCSPLLMGNTFAGGPKKTGIPTELSPIKPAEVKPQPVPVAVVVPVPEPPKKVVTCEWVKGPDRVSYVEGQSFSLSGIVVGICGCCGHGQVWLGGTSYQYPGQNLQSSSLTQVCK